MKCPQCHGLMVRDMCWDLEECTVCDYHDPVCELDVDVRLPVMLWVSHHVPLG
jgi:hypothetical protein